MLALRLSLILISWLPGLFGSGSPPENLPNAEELPVYRVILQNLKRKENGGAESEGQSVLSARSISVSIEGEKDTLGDELRDRMKRCQGTRSNLFCFPGAQPDTATLLDLRLKSRTRLDLKPVVAGCRNWRFLEEEERHAIFNDSLDEGWRHFYKSYPRAYLYDFSRVGFNRGSSEAIVYVEASGDWGQAGAGMFYLLHKFHRRWKVVNVIPCWVT